ncbi:MAG: hypothetical protein JXA25_18990 [Anaerolineales bacterium]|nr:hypothetical protein [Anaerolineales bacterium]
MTTNPQHIENRNRLNTITLLALATSVWDTLGRTAFAFSAPIGNHTLWMMERELDLEIIGEDPGEILMGICQVFIDEFGFASEIEISSDREGHFQVSVRDYEGLTFIHMLLSSGIEKPFLDPIMNTCQAMLRQMEFRMHQDLQIWEEGNGIIINFTEV